MQITNIVLLIPILAIVMSLGIPLLAIFLDYRKRRELFALHHQERMAAIEKGLELPPLPDAFFDIESDKADPPSPHRKLLIGLVWLFVGMAVLAAYWLSYWESLTIFGLIPTGIGLAYLIYYVTVGRKEAKQLELHLAKTPAAEQGGEA
jgi:hypothetical protein